MRPSAVLRDVDIVKERVLQAWITLHMFIMWHHVTE